MQNRAKGESILFYSLFPLFPSGRKIAGLSKVYMNLKNDQDAKPVKILLLQTHNVTRLKSVHKDMTYNPLSMCEH